DDRPLGRLRELHDAFRARRLCGRHSQRASEPDQVMGILGDVVLEPRLAQRAGRELGVERHRSDELVGLRVAIPGLARERSDLAHDRRVLAQVAARRNTTLRLFTGMATRSTKSSPCLPARAQTSPRSRTPQSGLLRRKPRSKAALLGAVWLPFSLKGP